MKTQEAQVVMLPTDKRSCLGLTKSNKLMLAPFKTTWELPYSNEFTGQHLYFISDEPIKEGDNIYNTVQKTIFIADKQFMKLIGNSLSTNKKIIATTNPDLWKILSDDKLEGRGIIINKEFGIPKIDTTFIEAYVREQGKIDKVLLEYEGIERYNVNVAVDGFIHKLKLKPNGSVTVHPVKEKMYSKEEHIINLIKYRLHYEQFKKDYYFGPNEKEIADWNNKWIEQHL